MVHILGVVLPDKQLAKVNTPLHILDTNYVTKHIICVACLDPLLRHWQQHSSAHLRPATNPRHMPSRTSNALPAHLAHGLPILANNRTFNPSSTASRYTLQSASTLNASAETTARDASAGTAHTRAAARSAHKQRQGWRRPAQEAED